MTTDERIEALFREARKVEGQKPRPRFSNAAGCMRAHVYDELALRDGTWDPEEDRPARWNAAARCGTALGEMLETAAQRLGALVQVPAALDADGNPTTRCPSLYGPPPLVTGHADIVWPDEVWDLKCVGDFSWRSAKKRPDYKHVVQVASYAHALGKPRWVLVYIDLGGIGKGRDLRYVKHEGGSDPRIAKRVVEHWKQVGGFADKRELPVRPHEDPDNFECNLCRHKTECWK